MINKDRWRIVFEYVMGILALTASVLLAVFGPELYARWQDGRLMGQVTLSSRESIQFLDADSLDVAGRLKMIGEASDFDWSYGEYIVVFAGESESVVAHCRDTVDLWCDQGLLPEECGSWLTSSSEMSIAFWLNCSFYVDQNILPVYIVSFYSPTYRDRMTMIIDRELDMIYYVSVSGPMIMEDMAQAMGCASVLELQQHLWEGDMAAGSDSAVSRMGFTEVCGAKSAEVDGLDDHWLRLNINLEFPGFSCISRREIIRNECGFGLALLYGSEVWIKVIAEAAMQCGYEESCQNLETWMEYVISEYMPENYGGNVETYGYPQENTAGAGYMAEEPYGEKDTYDIR